MLYEMDFNERCHQEQHIYFIKNSDNASYGICYAAIYLEELADSTLVV